MRTPVTVSQLRILAYCSMSIDECLAAGLSRATTDDSQGAHLGWRVGLICLPSAEYYGHGSRILARGSEVAMTWPALECVFVAGGGRGGRSGVGCR
jgi:hypothetical protein